MYSLSVDESAISVCSWDFQLTGQPAYIMMYPCLDLAVSRLWDRLVGLGRWSGRWSGSWMGGLVWSGWFGLVGSFGGLVWFGWVASAAAHCFLVSWLLVLKFS